MVHPLSIVCRSIVWFAVLLVSSDGKVAGFGEVRRVLCGVVFLTRRSVTHPKAAKHLRAQSNRCMMSTAIQPLSQMVVPRT